MLELDNNNKNGQNCIELQELGIEKISKTLSQLSKSVKKSPQAQVLFQSLFF